MIFSDRTVRRQNKFLGSAMIHHWCIYEVFDEKVKVIQEQLHQTPWPLVETLPITSQPWWCLGFFTALLLKEKLSAGS